MAYYNYLVTVQTDTQEHADQVMAERIYHDEDYGFEYRMAFGRHHEEAPIPPELLPHLTQEE